MANPEHLAILKQGVAVWNEWASETTWRVDLSGADLRGANLRGMKLSGADLSEADLCGAKLRGADLSGVNLRGANLSGARLIRANLSGSRLRGANLCEAELSDVNLGFASLIEANLSGANLGGVNFSFADLTAADLSNATLGSTVFAGMDLSTVRGLESAQHRGPSTIGIDTLYNSKGQIPEAFLRGCGVPETFITQAKALIGAEEGIQFYSCFISYSTKDEEFARRLHARLQQEHIRVWFAPHDMKSGEKLHEQIDTAIKVYDNLLILLSHHSLQSDWVKTELRKAYNAERKARKAEGKTGKRKLFPMRLVDYPTLTDWECFDSDSGTDLATEVRECFIPDFSNWKNHDAFEAAFARLLKDLRQSTQPAPGV